MFQKFLAVRLSRRKLLKYKRKLMKLVKGARKRRKNIQGILVSEGAIYVYILLLGIACIVSSFFFNETTNLQGVLSGVGTGIFTSMFVSFIINHENNIRFKRKIEEDRHFILGGLLESSKQIYLKLIYNINEYIMYHCDKFDYLYEVSKDYETVQKFFDSFKDINIETIDSEEKVRVEKLFSIGSYNITILVSELKRLSKKDYYLCGLIDKEEYSTLVSDSEIDLYIKSLEDITCFWNDKIIDIKKCSKFAYETLYITSKIINTIDYIKKEVNVEESNIKDQISDRYFEEIYFQSDEYAEKCEEEYEERVDYYKEHMDEYDEDEASYEEESERQLLLEINSCISGWTVYSLESILNKADLNSKKILEFFARDDVQKRLRYNLHNRRVVRRILGSKKEIKRKLKQIK